MTVKTILEGPYKWYVNAKTPEGGTYSDFREFTTTEINRVIDQMGLVEGQEIRVLVNGGIKPMWFTGTLVKIVKCGKLDQGYIELKQKKSTKYIDLWKIEAVEVEKAPVVEEEKEEKEMNLKTNEMVEFINENEKEIFKIIDNEYDGRVTPQELQEIAKKLMFAKEVVGYIEEEREVTCKYKNDDNEEVVVVGLPTYLSDSKRELFVNGADGYEHGIEVHKIIYLEA